MSTSLEDMRGGVSSCCGAKMYEDYRICSECKEHCDNVEVEDETDDRVFTSKQEEIIERLKAEAKQ